MLQEIHAVGTFEGTGVAINVRCGFKPRYIKIYNLDATNPATMEWWEGMAAGHGLKDDNSTLSRVTSNGISQYDTDYQGFTIGTDGINGNGETCFYVAVR